MQKLVLFVLSLQLYACASGPTPLKDRELKKELGFSFQPPQTEGWFETKPKEKKNTKVFAYGKKVGGVDPKKHSIVFSAQYGAFSTGLSKPEEVLNFVRMQKVNQLQGLRFQVLKDQSKFVTFKGAKCLEYDSQARDKYLNQNTTMTGLFCVHPDDHRRYIDISYSQRHEQNRQSVDIYDEGEAFVRGVAFLPILKKSQASR